MEDNYGYTFQYKWGDSSDSDYRNRTTPSFFDLINESEPESEMGAVNITGIPAYTIIPKGKQINTSLYEEAEVVV